MNWKQLYALATPQERREIALHLLMHIEARREVVVVYLDLRRILMRVVILGILAMLTLTTAFITYQAHALAAPALTAYLIGFLALFAFKPRRSPPILQAVYYV